MVLTLSKNAKAAVDAVLSVAGLVVGSLASGALQLPGAWQPAGSVIGAVGGYLVSDLLTEVDTGVPPSTATVTTQAGAAYGLARPLVAAEIAKLPAAQQAQANLALTVIDAVMAAEAPKSLVG